LLLDEQLDRLAHELLSKRKAVLQRARVENLDALVNHRPMHKIIRPPRGGGAGTRGEAEGVRVDELHAVDDVQGLSELFVGLTGEADNDVSGNRGPVESVVNVIDHPKEIAARILAVHAAEQQVGTAL